MNNIDKHKWSDENLTYISNHNDELQIHSDDSEYPFSLDKSDAIAIAKHFNLIPNNKTPAELMTNELKNKAVEHFNGFMNEGGE